MFIIEPIFHHTIWGGDRLVQFYGDDARNLGHLYSLRCFDSSSNIILNGEYAGEPLFKVIGKFPLSIAIDDAADDLSIQVHPGNENCKYESYYFLDAPEVGYIYSGIDNLSTEQIEELSSKGNILKHIGKLPVTSGDYVFIEPGTVHALAAGSLVYEIEQGVDITYRLFDYNRIDNSGNRRELQISDAVANINCNKNAYLKSYVVDNPIIEKTYSTKLLTNITSYENKGANFQVLTVLSERTKIEGIEMKLGMSVLILPNERIENIEILKCIVAEPLITCGGGA